MISHRQTESKVDRYRGKKCGRKGQIYQWTLGGSLCVCRKEREIDRWGGKGREQGEGKEKEWEKNKRVTKEGQWGGGGKKKG